MNVHDDAEVDEILAEADILNFDSPELLGAVRSSTNDTDGAEGMAPQEGGNGRVRNGGDSCHGSPPSLSQLG